MLILRISKRELKAVEKVAPYARVRYVKNLKKRIERYIYGGLFSEAELGNLKKRIESPRGDGRTLNTLTLPNLKKRIESETGEAGGLDTRGRHANLKKRIESG